MFEGRHLRVNLAMVQLWELSCEVLEVVHVIRLYPGRHICRSELIKGAFVLGLDLFELVRCHVVLEQVKVVVAVLTKVEDLLVLFGVDHSLDVESVRRVELYKSLVLLVQDHQEDVLVTLRRQLDTLLQNPSLTLVICYSVLFIHKYYIAALHDRN